MSNSGMPPAEREHLRYLRDLHFKNQEGRCYYCEVEMTPADVPDPKPPTTVTIEHLRGRAIGGGSNYLNTAASCLECNNKRAQQKAVGKRTVPRMRVVAKTVFEHTYAYTVPSKPDVLVLANTTLRRDDALLAFKQREGEPITLKFITKIP